MKRVILGSTLAAFSLASFADAQRMTRDVVVASDIRYILTGVNTSYMFRPDDSSASAAPALPLSDEEILSRCDELVAVITKQLGPAGTGGARLVRERVEDRRDLLIWVLYAQRHQGFPILGAGGRLEVNTYGKVLFGGLSYETERLRAFRPMASAGLERLAARAVPHWRLGPPIGQVLMIDPRGDAPAELRAYVQFRVRTLFREEGWPVVLNAETGKLIDSSSMVMNAASR